MVLPGGASGLSGAPSVLVANDPRLDALAAQFEKMKKPVERDATITELLAKAKTLGVNVADFDLEGNFIREVQ
jgi:hypothetical protein